MTEFDHPVPEMETIRDVLDYVRSRAEALGAGKWVVVRQVFITRLKEQRYPTRDELDRAAPENPVLFSTGPDASLNSLALKLSGIDKDFRPEGPGKVEKDPRTGEPTGILRNLHAVRQGDVRRSASPPSRTRTGACSSCSRTTTRSGSRPSSTATPAMRPSSATAGCTRPAR